MAARGDFTPLATGEITTDHFLSEQGKTVSDFVLRFSNTSGNAARWPSLIILRSRFHRAGFDFPEPDPGDTVGALTHEVIIQKLRRDIQAASSDLSRIAAMPDPREHVSAAVSTLKTSVERSQKAKHISLNDEFEDVCAEYDGGALQPMGIGWPWPSMTAATRGLHTKEWIVIGGRPKNKKTFTAIEVVTHGFKTGHDVLVFTPEMPPRQILYRFIASLCGIRYTELKNGTLDDGEVQRLVLACGRYGKYRDQDTTAGIETKTGARVDIIQSTGKSVSWMQSQIAVYKPKIVLVDSFYRHIPDGGKRHDSDWKQVTAMSRSMKDMAMEEAIVCIGTHQMNKGAAGNSNAGLEHLSLADAVGQDADLILQTVSGFIQSDPVTALRVLGGREVPFPGVLLNSNPYINYSEIGPITNMSVIKKLLAQADSEDEEKEKAKKTVAKAKKSSLVKTRPTK